MRLMHAVAVALLALGLTASGACNRGPDPKDNVQRALTDANIKDVNVNYDRDTKVVHLTGSVDSADEKQRAEEVANRAVGTSGRVLNEVTVKGEDASRANDLDGQIRRTLNDKIDSDPVLKERDVNFDVNNGAVEIKGSVASAAEKEKVGQLVRGVDGVKDVANALEIKPQDYRGNAPARQPRNR